MCSKLEPSEEHESDYSIFEGRFERPVFAPDDRQKFLHTAVKEMRKNHDSVDSTNTTYGWHASYVNLGWIQDTVKPLLVDGTVTTYNHMFDFLSYTVQRLKTVDPIEVRNKIVGDMSRWIVKFVTKDDGGYYVYEFSVTFLPK